MQACRSLIRRPAFFAATVLTLGFGVSVMTALFSVVDTVLIKPLPFPAPDRLVTVYEASPAKRDRTSLIAPARLDDWNRLNRTFEAISGSYTENVTDTSGAEPERLEGRRVMPRYFAVFGMPPLAGRLFTEPEERFGGPKAAVIGERFWVRRFGRHPSAIGHRFVIGGTGFTIVGVMPRTFAGAAIDVWVPAQLAPQMMSHRDARFLGGIGRMKPGTTIEAARVDLARVQHLLGEQFPATDQDWSVSIADLKETRVGGSRRALTMVFGAAALLLLIAVANIAGLVLVQLQRREAEIAIRTAIGGSRIQVVSALMREMVILAAAGAALGGVAAVWLVKAAAVTLTTLPRMAELTLDWNALAFTTAISAAAALVFGLLPALHATRAPFAPTVASGARGIAGGRHRLQGALVVAQIALSLLLAGSAGLLVRSYYNLTRIDAGFQPHAAITFHVGAAWDEDRARIGHLQEGLISGLQGLPGVQAAGLTNFLPATGATLRYEVQLDGLPGSQGTGKLTVGERTVSAGYLRALQVPLVAGEWCPDLRYDLNAPGTALVNRRFVDRYGGGQNIIGRRFRFDFGGTDWRIVGIVADMIEDGPGTQPAPYVYVCMSAGSWPDPEYVVRAGGDPRLVVSQIRQLVHTLDPNRPLFGVRPLDDVLSDALDEPRLNARMLGLFAATAMALASVGLYGLMMLTVTERRRELGVRMALGATPSAVVWLVCTGAARLLAGGVIAGLALTIGAGHALGAVLFGVTPLDARALAGAIAALTMVAIVAVAIPARKASTIGAMDAIRGD